MSNIVKPERDEPAEISAAGHPLRGGGRISADEMLRLVASAARAPSLHNSQPWRFQLGDSAIELRSDRSRQLRQADPDGREMLISCGAVLFGLRLGMRELGFQPVTEILPDPAEPGLIASVRPGGRVRLSREERDMVAALPHRHTHRGPFGPGRVPGRLLDALVAEAAAEGAELRLLSGPGEVRDLAELTAAASREQRASPEMRAEVRRWSRPAGSRDKDGIPARSRIRAARVPLSRWRRQEEPAHERLTQRDFGLPGELPAGGWLPSATAVLTTAGDSPADWIAAGQALHRLLLRAATRWVFASLQSQPLESPWLREGVRDCLRLRGMPQMLLQFGRANTAAATPRRPVAEADRP